MKRKLAVCTIVLVVVSGVAQAQDPVAVLQSDAGYPEKAEACRVLARTGGAEAVPALEALLGDEKLSHMARYALEVNPSAEAGAALRRALRTVGDAQKIGIMSTLAVRQDVEAIPLMVEVLMTEGSTARAEAARALSRLVALDVEVDMAKVSERPGVLAALAPDLLNLAQRLLDDGRGAAAIAIYDVLRVNAEVPGPVQDGALRGAILARGVDGVSLLLESLHTDDADEFDAAIRTARELGGGDKVTGALAEALGELPDWAKVTVLQVIGERGGAAAGPAVAALAAEGASEVRVAAINALARIAYAPALDSLEKLSWSDDEAVAKAAQDALIYFPGGKGDEILLAMLGRPETATRLVAVDLVARGGLDDPVVALMNVAGTDQDEEVRVAALKALREFAGLDELPALLGALRKTASAPERRALENALQAICKREQKTSSADVEIRRARYGDLPDGSFADVTEKVAKIVAQGKMEVEASNANFGDPASGKTKQLTVEYVANGVPMRKTVGENETMRLTAAYVPESIVQAFLKAQATAEGETKLSLLRLLGETGSQKALDAVLAVANGDGGAPRDTAQTVLCAWPTPAALPAVMKLAVEAPEQDLRTLALRGAIRLLNESGGNSDQALPEYASLMANAKTADDRKVLLSGLAKVAHARALDMALRWVGDAEVRNEAVQAVRSIDKELGERGRKDDGLSSPARWQGNMDYWRVENGVVTGHSDAEIPRNEFLWADGEVKDFYLDLDVKLEPNSANAGIQFRSKKIDDAGQAQGYQADVGQGYWGKLYHEHGRGMLDDTAAAEAAVKAGEWNHYEVLAVGPVVWIAINGTLGAAFLDTAADAQTAGALALQMHGGPAQTVQYRINKLVHDPELKLSAQDAETLLQALKP